MNQAILFNDDLTFDKQNDVYHLTGLLAGEVITIYFHSTRLKQLNVRDSCTQFGLEEAVEVWLAENEPEDSVIHVTIP